MQEYRAATVLGYLGPIAGIPCVAWSVFYAWAGYPWPVVVSALFVPLLGLSVPWLLRWGVQATHMGVAAAILLMVAIVTPTLYSGGIYSFNVSWLTMVPYIAVIAGTRRRLILLALVIVGTMGGLALAGHLNWLPEPHVPYPTGQFLVSWGSAVLVMTVTSLLHNRVVDKVIDDERAISSHLQVEVSEHRNTREELEAAQSELVDSARTAGMAEVANGVLHNVGNGLNTVNVAVALFAQRPPPVPLDRIAHLADLLENGEVEVTAAAKYLRKVSELGREKHHSYREELGQLRKQIEHVNTVVQAQQAHARHGGLTEDVEVEELVNDAMLLVASRLVRAQVDVRIDPIPKLTADRNKTLLILLNLLNNAADAVRDRSQPAIDVWVRQQDEAVTFTVRDNGVGIEPEMLNAIFRHGVTTKTDGHGFGLHSSVLAARELGGDLTVHSDGPNHGAAFTLELPVMAA